MSHSAHGKSQLSGRLYVIDYICHLKFGNSTQWRRKSSTCPFHNLPRRSTRKWVCLKYSEIPSADILLKKTRSLTSCYPFCEYAKVQKLRITIHAEKSKHWYKDVNHVCNDLSLGIRSCIEGSLLKIFTRI